MRTGAALAVCALACAALALWVLGRSEPPPPPAPVVRVTTAAPAPAPPAPVPLAPAPDPVAAPGESLAEDQPAREVTGVVRDAATGQGIAGARVALRRRDGAGDVQGQVATEDGRFAFPAAPEGALEVMAIAEGWRLPEEPAVVAPGVHAFEVTLEREPPAAAPRAATRRVGCCDDEEVATGAPCAVKAGAFLGADGRPLRGALGCDPDDPAQEPLDVPLDAQGRPALDQLPAGRWAFHVLEPPPPGEEELRAWVLEVDVKPGEPLELALDARGPRARLEGAVHGARSEELVQVDVRPATPGPAFAFVAARAVGEDGRFAFPAVPPGQYLVRAIVGEQACEAAVEVREGVPAWVDLTAP